MFGNSHIVNPRNLEHGFRMLRCWDPLYLTIKGMRIITTLGNSGVEGLGF